MRWHSITNLPLNATAGRRAILLSTQPHNPKRGEVWLVNLDPVTGAEIRKTRPVVVLSTDAIRVLPLRLVAPLTSWQDHFENKFWLV